MEHLKDAVLQRLKDHDALHAEEDGAWITVKSSAPNGFDVSISGDEKDSYMVSFGGWHEHFEVLEDALNCFAFGLSDQCRLRVTKRGAFECAWTVQSLQNGVWVDDMTTGLILVPFWRKRHTEYRRNATPPTQESQTPHDPQL